MTAIDGNGNLLKEGDRVWTYDWGYIPLQGTLKENTEHKDVSEWYVAWDDGENCAVLNFDFIWKV